MFDFISSESFILAASCVAGGVVLGVTLKFGYDHFSKSWDLNKKSYEAIEKAFTEAESTGKGDDLVTAMAKVRKTARAKKCENVVKLCENISEWSILKRYVMCKPVEYKVVPPNCSAEEKQAIEKENDERARDDFGLSRGQLIKMNQLTVDIKAALKEGTNRNWYGGKKK
jgi:hypothetical protein